MSQQKLGWFESYRVMNGDLSKSTITSEQRIPKLPKFWWFVAIVWTTINFTGSSPIDGWRATATRALQEPDASGVSLSIMAAIQTLSPQQTINAKASGDF